MRATKEETDWREVWSHYCCEPEVYNQQIFTFQIAEHLFRRGEDLAALAAFREALEYDPKNLRALRGLVSLLQKRGRQEEAVMYLRRQAGAEMEHLHLPQEIVDTIVSFRMAVLGGAPGRPGHRPITSQRTSIIMRLTLNTTCARPWSTGDRNCCRKR